MHAAGRHLVLDVPHKKKSRGVTYGKNSVVEGFWKSRLQYTRCRRISSREKMSEWKSATRGCMNCFRMPTYISPVASAKEKGPIILPFTVTP
jgi:hypothetical protein